MVDKKSYPQAGNLVNAGVIASVIAYASAN
jgi:hypothetical protein